MKSWKSCGRNGTTRWVSLTVRPIRDAAGEFVATRSMAVDVTEHKRLEDQLRQGQKMEAVGELTAGIAHNFNNMLQAIRGNLDLVIKYRGDDAGELLSEASHAASRAAEMVQQLMVFSRQGLQPEHGPVTLQQIAKETVEICRKAFDRKINISIDSIGDPGPILGDAGQLSQILMNLCINARDAFADVVDRPHQIRIEVEEPSHYVRPPLNNPATLGRYVRMRIIDNGTGMDEETRKRVFDPFFTTKEVDEGYRPGSFNGLRNNPATWWVGNLRYQTRRRHDIFSLPAGDHADNRWPRYALDRGWTQGFGDDPAD